MNTNKLIGTIRAAGIGASTAIILAGVADCGWWDNGGSQTVTNQAGQGLSCILAQVESGNIDPAAVAVACVGGDIGAFISDVESIIAYYSQPSPLPPVDSGPIVAAVVGAQCGDTTKAPPYQGAPACISLQTIASLNKMHDQAKATLATLKHG
jgi:hypothetical protein